MAEAAIQIEKALVQLALLPENRERMKQELDLHSALGSVSIAIHGFAGVQTGHSYSRGRELWEQLGYPTEFLRIPWGEWIYHANRGDLRRARPLAEGLLQLGRQWDYGAGVILGHLCLGATFMVRGEFDASLTQFEQAVRHFDPEEHRSLVHETGIDQKVMTLSFIGFIEFILGYPDRALASIGEGTARARQLQHLPSLATNLSVGTRTLALVGNDQLFADCANQLLTLGEEHSFPFWRTQGVIYRGWLKIGGGKINAGIASIREGIAAYQATGAIIWTPFYVALLAEAERRRGHANGALEMLNEVLGASREREENWFEAELVRRRGMLLQRKDQVAAELAFQEALAIAGRQNAKLWELRAAASLARLRCDQGRHAEARDLLTPVYGWFTEGFDTPDLNEAKALLDELP
jgi:predicted ATPase